MKDSGLRFGVLSSTVWGFKSGFLESSGIYEGPILLESIRVAIRDTVGFQGLGLSEFPVTA